MSKLLSIVLVLVLVVFMGVTIFIEGMPGGGDSVMDQIQNTAGESIERIDSLNDKLKTLN